MDIFEKFFFATRKTLLLSLVFGVLLCLILIFIGNEDGFLWFNTTLTPVLGRPAAFFSQFGEWYVMIFLLASCLWISIRKFISVAFTWIIGACLSWMFKLWLFKGLARPSEYYASQNIPLQLVDGVDVHSYNTFPSGHTLTAFSSIVLFRFVFLHLKSWQEYILVFFAIACGLSRIILVQHWPEDVLGGIVLGLFAGYSGVFFSLRISKNESLDRSVIKL